MILKRGDAVTYIPFPDAERSIWEKGIVKATMEEGDEYVWVVYKCGNNWDKYSDYTAAKTHITDLKFGWK